MKPMIIIPPDLMDKDSIELLRANDICVVVATDPAKVRFLDPIPAASQRGQIDAAAIQLSRILLNGQWSGNSSALNRSDFARLYVECLVRGTELDPNKAIEQHIFDTEKAEEIRRLARAEAKAEREAKKKKS